MKRDGRNGPNRFVTYVYSHTHMPVAPFKLNAPGSTWTPTVVNSGAFQRVASKAWVDTLKKPEDVLTQDLSALPGCYPFVRVLSGKEEAPELRAWIGKGDASKEVRFRSWEDCNK